MEVISQRQLYLIGVGYTLNATLVSVPTLVYEAGRMDSWVCFLLAGGIISSAVWALAVIMNRYPNQDLFTILRLRRPAVGRFISLVYIGFFFFIFCRDLRMLADFSNLALLPFTPLPVITGLVLFCCVWIARGGIEILGRMSELRLPLLLLFIPIIPFLLIRDFDIRFIQPVLTSGFVPILKGTWYVVAFFGEIVALPFLMFSPVFNLKSGFKGLAIGVSTMTILGVSTLLVLGSFIASRNIYPTYEMIRQIRLTDFLDRFELPIVGLWMPSMITKISFSLYVVCHGMEQTFTQLKAKELVFPFGIFAFVCSFWFFKSAIQSFDLMRTWPYIALIFELIIPLLLLFLLRPKSQKAPHQAKGGEPHGRQEQQAG